MFVTLPDAVNLFPLAVLHCPGVFSSALLYVPLSTVVVTATLTQGPLTHSLLLTALVVATIVHALEVGHTVFKRW